MRYKVGDKVRVKSKAWFDSMPKDDIGSIQMHDLTFTKTMSKYCGKTVTIKKVYTDGYRLLECDFFVWQDDMFEDSILDYLQIGTKFKVNNLWYVICKDIFGNLYGISNTGKHYDLEELEQITEIRTYRYPEHLQDSYAGILIWKKPYFNKGDIVAMYNNTYENYNIGIMLDSNIISCITDIDGKLANQLDKDQNFQLSEFVLANVYQQNLFHDAVMRSGGYLDSNYRWIPFKIGDKVKVSINGCWISTVVRKIIDDKIYTDKSYYSATYLLKD